MTGSVLNSRAAGHSLRMVSHLSVTGSPGERDFPDVLEAMIRELPCAPAVEVCRAPVPGLPAGRSNLLALVRGEGPRTVVLAGHFDVVGVADYGPLEQLATDPAGLSAALVERLRQSGEAPAALDDLANGLFLPGRGLLDMKSGLGAGLATLEDFAGRGGFSGNVVLLACPDEENQSAGMRAAGELLQAVASERRLALDLIINLDALQDPGDGSLGQMIGLGSIGKHLVTALVIGRPAHACYPFNGLSAAYLASELVVAIEGEPRLADRQEGEVSAPPAVLVQRDLKPAYDVTTPERAWCAWNVIVQTRTAARVLADFRAIAGEAVQGATLRMTERARAAGLERWDPGAIPVLGFDAVEAEAQRSVGYEPAKAALVAELAMRGDLSMPEQAQRLSELAWDHSGLRGPAVVLGFGSLSYPRVPPLRERGAGDLEEVVRAAAAGVAARWGTSIGFCDYLPIVSDMSFPGLDDVEDYRVATDNNPLWGSLLDWDYLQYPRIPVINIGPWGRDYHHFLERVHVGYSFHVLPDLLLKVTQAVLNRSTTGAE